ncbi:MAG: SDR family NAD(P)-dependent oxidoreductase [Panacagrimonas sp.]
MNTRPLCAIVGAGEGLGVALARAFARQGNDLLLVGRSAAGQAAAREAAVAAGAKVTIEEADARDPAALTKALGAASSAEVLIYNPRAGLTFKPPLEVTAEELQDILALEVVGAFTAARAVLPAMIERGRGTIIFSSATAALRGSGRNLLYATGKFGLRGMAQSLAKAYGAKGVHVAHVRLDCALDVPVVKKMMGNNYDKSRTADTDDVAQSYVWIHQQPRSAWSNEIELRPYTEDWTY